MKVAVYCRVSTQDQNLQQQIDKLIEFCNTRQWEYELFVEKESSRGTRPIKTELLDQLRKYKFNSVLVWKLDRWGRSLKEIVNEIEELRNKGISFVSYTDNIDLTTSSGRAQFGMISVFAQFERDLISERTKLALQCKKERGQKLGRPRGAHDTHSRQRRWAKKPV